MTAYHATHESPYADDCPDCTGMADPDPVEDRDWSRLVTLICLGGMLLILVAVWGYTR